ncbi:MAG: hypothetical protein C7B46_02005 [Sulfobacillus benefaciens]|uniref:Uncharacterized protein n=1 Tax=Sulfobacillus benefaciens TaxID=453960 RepID=A0A2T2XL29_9FIRM|nr:MAG: hypothetical protein C7B46_02005 [Sulfobacillus benefaciens]
MLRQLLEEFLFRIPVGLSITLLLYVFDPYIIHSIIALIALSLGLTILYWYGSLLLTLWHYHVPSDYRSHLSRSRKVVAWHPRYHG